MNDGNWRDHRPANEAWADRGRYWNNNRVAPRGRDSSSGPRSPNPPPYPQNVGRPNFEDYRVDFPYRRGFGRDNYPHVHSRSPSPSQDRREYRRHGGGDNAYNNPTSRRRSRDWSRDAGYYEDRHGGGNAAQEDRYRLPPPAQRSRSRDRRMRDERFLQPQQPARQRHPEEEDSSFAARRGPAYNSSRKNNRYYDGRAPLYREEPVMNRRRRRRRGGRNRENHRARSPESSFSGPEDPPRPPVQEALPRAGVVSDDEQDGGNSNQMPASTNSNRGSNRVVSKKQQARREDAPEMRAATGARSPSSEHDDSVGHFRGEAGTVIADRYSIVREVGVGTFGRVVECLDLRVQHQERRQQRRSFERESVAIKIVRKVKRYYESALIEAKIVNEVNRRGGRGLTHCVVLHDAFTFAGHYCMVFESLGPSLYEFLRRHKYQPFPMVCIQDFTIQLLETLEFLHCFRLIHTDLKIENVLLMNNREVSYFHQRVPESTRIKVIDFGGACYDTDKKSSVINTRQYRAPEVILGTGWSMPSDMWSIGCILAELYQGELLFATHDNLEHLALMERIVGPFPPRLLKKAKTSTDIASQAFDSNGRHRMERVLPAENASFVEKAVPLEVAIRKPEDAWFLDLLRMILVIDPDQRATAHECLQFLARIRKNVVRYN